MINRDQFTGIAKTLLEIADRTCRLLEFYPDRAAPVCQQCGTKDRPLHCNNYVDKHVAVCDVCYEALTEFYGLESLVTRDR